MQEDNVKMGSNVFFSLTRPRPSVTPISNDIVVLIQRDRPRAQDSLCIISNLQKSAAVANEKGITIETISILFAFMSHQPAAEQLG